MIQDKKQMLETIKMYYIKESELQQKLKDEVSRNYIEINDLYCYLKYNNNVNNVFSHWKVKNYLGF